MTVVTGKNFIFVKVEQGISKKSGNPYCMVTLSADYENHQLGVSSDFDKSIFSTLKRGQIIDCVFSLENRFGDTNLVLLEISAPLEAAQAKK